MRKSLGIIAALVVAFACIAGSDPAQAGGPKNVTATKSLVATAGFETGSGGTYTQNGVTHPCIVTQVGLGGILNTGTGVQTGFITITQVNYCDPFSYFFGSTDPVPLTGLTIPSNLSTASLNTTVHLTGITCSIGCGAVSEDATVNVNWTAISTSSTSNSIYHFLGAGNLTNLMFAGSTRDAVASGTVTTPSLSGNLTPGTSMIGVIGASSDVTLTSQ